MTEEDESTHHRRLLVQPFYNITELRTSPGALLPAVTHQLGILLWSVLGDGRSVASLDVVQQHVNEAKFTSVGGLAMRRLPEDNSKAADTSIKVKHRENRRNQYPYGQNLSFCSSVLASDIRKNTIIVNAEKKRRCVENLMCVVLSSWLFFWTIPAYLCLTLNTLPFLEHQQSRRLLCSCDPVLTRSRGANA